MTKESESAESIESMDTEDADGNYVQDNGKFQSVNKLLNYIPYAEALSKEADYYLQKIQENLTKAILSRNIQLATAAYTKSINSYIHQFGFRMTKEQHVAFIKLYFELLTMEECPLNVVGTFCQTYCLLLKKPHLLTRDDITVPWRPLYMTLERCVWKRKYTLSLAASKGLETHIKSAILSSNKYFGDNTLTEVTETFKPLICPSTCKMVHCLDMLKLFLPYFNPENVPEFNKFLEFMLEIYNCWNNNPTWEWNMISLLGNCSWHMIGKFDWLPHLPVMYSRLMKQLCLPVYFKGLQNTPVEQSTKSFDAASAARFIVGTLGNQPDAIKNLKNFLETVETYYNPLNMGRWSGPLATLLNEMVSIFTTRLKRERYSVSETRHWWVSIPANRRLTDEDIDEFVQMTSELVLDFYVDVASGGFILKNLACIRPQKIIPAVMSKYESMVETVTEPKKYLITMRWVTIVLLPLVSVRQQEDGYDSRGMVIPFALSLLPTITCNDMQKTLSALGVIHGLFNLIPLVDCSSLAETLEDENERNVCTETSCLEDFCLQFLDSILALVESKSHENTRSIDHRASNAGVNLEDLSLEKLLWAVCHRLGVQASTKIFKSLAKKIVGFAFSKILETDVSGRLYASILQAFAAARPDIILPKLLPKLCSSIESLIADDILNEEELDKFLLFHILILSSIVETTGTELMKYRKELESVLKSLLKLNGKKPYIFVSNLLQRLLNSLVYFYPIENRISEADFDDPNYLAIQDWGLMMEKSKIHVKWHIPSKEELIWAKDIFLQVFTEFSAKYEGIERLTQKDETINKNLLKDLHILIALVDGLQPLLPFWDNKPFKAFEDVQIDFTPLEYDFGLPMVDVKVPETGQNIKEKYFEIYCGIKTYLDKFKDDDTEVYIQLIKGMDNLVFNNIEPDRRMAIPMVKNLRHNLQNTLNPKRKSTRGNLVARVFEFHLKRLRLSMTRTWSKSHMLIMEKLFELSVNRYARIRITAQSRFCRMVDTVGGIITREITGLLIDKLKDGVPHDEYKGVLYTILTCKNSPLLNNSWSQLCHLWVALLHSPFSEKNSIIKCMDTIRKLLSQSFMYFPLEDQVSLKAIEYAKNLVSPSQIETWGLLKGLQNGIENREAFDKMISDLLASPENGLNHWRQQVLCCNMLSVLIVEEKAMPRKMVEYFYDCLISSSVDVRTTALHTISWVTIMCKRKMDSVEVDTQTGLKIKEGESIHSVLQYKSNPSEEGIHCGKLEVEDTKGKNLSKFYVHKMYYGYVTLPPILKIKLPVEDYTDLSGQTESAKVILDVAMRYFKNPDFVSKLFEFFTQEEKGGKSCGNKRTRLFISLTRNNGPEALKLVLKAIAPLTKDKDQWKQRCAADVISGIIYGLKLWDDECIVEFWTELCPMLNDCLDSVTQETLSYWSESMKIPTSNRDPNMMRFFIELMKERWFTSLQSVESTSVDAYKNMNFFDNTVANLHWRGAELYHWVFASVQKYFIETPIPYVNVRDQLGRLIGDIFEWAAEQPVTFETQVSPKFDPFVNTLFESLGNLIPEAAKYMANEKDSEDNSEARKLLLRFKSVLELVVSLCWDSETSVDPVLYRFIPLCCHFESYDADPELKSLAAVTLSGFSRILILPKSIDLVLDQVELASTSTSWKSRLCVVEFLKVFALNNTNIFASSEKFSNRVMDFVLSLLSDRKIEVRESASKLLSGFLHSLIIQKPMELLETFQRQAKIFSRKLQVAWKKTPRGCLSSEEIDTGHSAVLGLCAFVDTYPYDVPQFLPNILITLSTHLHDPQPIPITLRKCLSNFRRTHHDNWAVHKTKFSEDQLCILTDIFVSPCYYA